MAWFMYQDDFVARRSGHGSRATGHVFVDRRRVLWVHTQETHAGCSMLDAREYRVSSIEYRVSI